MQNHTLFIINVELNWIGNSWANEMVDLVKAIAI